MLGTGPSSIVPGSGVTPYLDDDQKVEAGLKKIKGGGFQTMGLRKDELNSVLKMGFNVPTPIQRKAIPLLLQGTDVAAMARTGSGKTAAYGIPIIHKLEKHCTTVGVRAIVFAPTRELSLQIMRHMQKMSKHSDLRYCSLVGGNSLDSQFARLASNPDILIATPGRLLHIMEDAKYHLYRCQFLVLDEADRLFELGLQAQVTAILSRTPEECQRALFSATMPSVLAEFAEAKLSTPAVIRLDAEIKLSDNLKQSSFVCRSEEKTAALLFILRKVIQCDAKSNQVLVFVESRHHVDALCALLVDSFSYNARGVHGNMDQEARKTAVDAFSRRQASILVTTDVAARGLDMPLLDNVVNYSFPPSAKLFVHRVGRVARAGRNGAAYSLLTVDDMPRYVDLMTFLAMPLRCRPPSEEELENQRQKRVDLERRGVYVADAHEDIAFTADNGCYGRLPEHQLQHEQANIQSAFAKNEDLRDLWMIAERAHGKFYRTLQKASREGIKEARLEGGDLRFANVPTHPMFLDDTKAQATEAAVKHLRNFKAKAGETYLEMVEGEGRLFAIERKTTIQSMRQEKAAYVAEAEAAASQGTATPAPVVPAKPTKKGSKAAPAPPVVPEVKLSLAERLLVQAQDRKRQRDDGKRQSIAAKLLGSEGNPDVADIDDGPVGFADIPTAGKPLSPVIPGKPDFRDRNFFLDDAKVLTIQDAAYSLRDAALDMGPESAEDAQQQRSVFTWNKKKSRYVKVAVSDAKALMKGMKNEAGKKIDFKAKLDAYVKWTRSSNLRIQDCGEEEDVASVNKARAAARGDDVDEAAKDEDMVDISDPNAGKKVRMGKKLRSMPKDGKVRSFEEIALHKKQEAEKRAKNNGQRVSAKKATVGLSSLRRGGTSRGAMRTSGGGGGGGGGGGKKGGKKSSRK